MQGVLVCVDRKGDEMVCMRLCFGSLKAVVVQSSNATSPSPLDSRTPTLIRKSFKLLEAAKIIMSSYFCVYRVYKGRGGT